MRRSTHTGRTLAWRYGERHDLGGARSDPAGSEAIAQLRLANRLWNALVEAERTHEERVDALWSAHPEIVDSTAAVEAAADVAAELDRQLQAARARTRSVPKELRRAVRDAATALRAARLAQRELKAVVYNSLLPAFQEHQERRRAVIKQLGREAKAEGLYWPIHDAVLGDFYVAHAKMRKHRAAGQRSELRFHRFDGTGTWTTPLGRSADEPKRTYEILAAGTSPWRNLVRFEPPPSFVDWETLSISERRRRGRTTVAIRIGSDDTGGPVWLRIPIVMHRPIPEEADIASVKVIRERVGTHLRHSVVFTLLLSAVEEHERPGIVAVDLGWRRLDDGSIRVAALVTRGDYLLPAELLPEWFRVDGTGRSAEVVLPSSWQGKWRRTVKLASLRDEKMNAIRDQLATFLDGHPHAAASLHVAPDEVRLWRSKAQLAALVITWRAFRVEDDHAIFAAVEAWRHEDRHLYEWEANLRDQLLTRRREAYRVIAAQLVATYGTVVTKDIALAALTRRPASEDDVDHMAESARSQARMAAPGTFREQLRQVAAREGVTFTQLEGAWTTRVHASCGTTVTEDSAESVMLWCPACEVAFDQDINAATNLIRLATGEVESLTTTTSLSDHR